MKTEIVMLRVRTACSIRELRPRQKQLYTRALSGYAMLEIIFLYSEDICPFKSSFWSDI